MGLVLISGWLKIQLTQNNIEGEGVFSNIAKKTKQNKTVNVPSSLKSTDFTCVHLISVIKFDTQQPTEKCNVFLKWKKEGNLTFTRHAL